MKARLMMMMMMTMMNDDATVLYCLSVCVVYAAGPDGEYTSDVSTSICLSVCALVCV